MKGARGGGTGRAGRGVGALLLALLAGVSSAAQESMLPEGGIDPDGRIPYVDRPPGLKHPDRWRYIPEGRIRPGNVFQRLFLTSVIAPFVFKSSDAGYGGGLAIADVDFRGSRRQEFLGLFGSYTTRQQQSYGAVWRRHLHHLELPGGGVLIEERSAVRAFAGYSRTRSRRFFGLGPTTNEDDETRYEDRRAEVSLSLETSVPDPGDDLIVSAGIAGELHRLGDALGSKPDSEDVFPALFADADSNDLLWLRTGARWDTRDSQTNPYEGWHVGGEVEAALLQSGGDLGARYSLGGSKVFRLPGLFHAGDFPGEENPPTDTLVFGLRTELTSGDLPFFALPELGGDALRGFVRGRFRDDATWLGSAEYRFWVIERGLGFSRTLRLERIGAALFYEIGSVAGDGVDLFDAQVQHSYGFSLIASLERALPFRANFGFSKEGVNITAGFGLSF